jgi:hypothetical protein
MELTRELFEESFEMQINLINNKIHPDNIENITSHIPLAIREEFYLHLNTLLLNDVINSNLYGHTEEIVWNASRCRSVISDLIKELRDPNYIQIKRDKNINKILS